MAVNNHTNDFDELENITISVTSSISKNGKLTNLTSHFSQDEISPVDNPINELGPSPPVKTTLEISPTKEIIPGNYTLTISAKYGKDITVSKIIDMIIR